MVTVAIKSKTLFLMEDQSCYINLGNILKNGYQHSDKVHLVKTMAASSLLVDAKVGPQEN